jgi:glyoxylase-like metal-dependent hydrolase (beta-lactamase superfamily II)
MPNGRAAIIPVTPFQQNCTLLWCQKTMRAAVIDPGGDLDRIRHVVDQAGVTVEKILLTHGHIDHAGGAADLKDSLAVPIEGPHEADRFLLDHLEEQGRAYGFPGVRNVAPDRWLSEGNRVSVGELTFDVLHCPGHSPGSVVFVNGEERFAIMGDVLFQGSVGRTDLPGGSHEALIRSIKEKVLPLGDDVAFICGHGPASTIGQERLTNPFLQAA